MKTRLVTGVLVACAIAASATPAFGDSGGTVSAQVTVAAPCIQVAPPSLDFGALGFSTAALEANSPLLDVTATNCGTARQSLLARGTNAAGSGGSSWTLVGFNLCDAPNRFGQILLRNAQQFDLTTVDLAIGTPLGATEVAAMRAGMIMPCAGSNGAGEVMTFSYLFTAVLA